MKASASGSWLAPSTAAVAPSVERWPTLGPWTYQRRRPLTEPVMGPVAGIVMSWLEEDLQRPRKQRHTAKRIWERLVAEYDFPGAETTVRQWCERIARRRRER